MSGAIGGRRRRGGLGAAMMVVAATTAVATATATAAAADPTAERCFGAASRVPGAPCVNTALRTLVVPTPAAAQVAPRADCLAAFRSRDLLCAAGAGCRLRAPCAQPH